MKRSARPPFVVGWKEFVEFVEWPLRRVKAKIDTGARTSALDVLSYELRETAAGMIAVLRLALDPKHPERVAEVETKVLRMVIVRNSGGLGEHRPVVETVLRIGCVTKRVRFTVTNRSGMRFRMILGRRALQGDFVVDVAKKYLLRQAK